MIVGGAGPRTLDLVRRHADWWNLPAPDAHRLPELRPQVGTARVSMQRPVAMVGQDAASEKLERRTRATFSTLCDGLVLGDADLLGEHFEGLARQGVERFYVWFADRAPVDAITRFAGQV